MDNEVRFAADLYRGSAGYYDQYRLPYPDAMLADLVRRAEVSGSGRLLDLACGTGQLAFPLRRWFAEVRAVDSEPDMVEVVRAKAAAGGARDVRPIVSGAETLQAEPGYFELVVVGNAFHRLDRDLVAGRILGWLKPGGYLALCWSSVPWIGERAWQRTLAATLDRWKAALGAEHRIPAGWNLVRQRRPDRQVLSDAGFEAAGYHEFAIEHRWTLPELAGFIRSTSFLPVAVLGDQADAFDADLAARLGPHSHDGAFTMTVSFTYELARKARDQRSRWSELPAGGSCYVRPSVLWLVITHSPPGGGRRMTAASAEVAVDSLEVRWIVPGAPGTAVLDWFGRFPDSTETREDAYLLQPYLRGLSVKLRGGTTLDVKSYLGSPGILETPVRGRLESWRKWSFPCDPMDHWDTAPSGWFTIRKRRHRTWFPLAVGRDPVPAPWPAADVGCAAELTEADAAGQPWWSVGFEAIGPVALLRDALQRAATIASLSRCRRESDSAWITPGPTHNGCSGTTGRYDLNGFAVR